MSYLQVSMYNVQLMAIVDRIDYLREVPLRFHFGQSFAVALLIEVFIPKSGK